MAYKSNPVIILAGDGGSGKDTIAALIRDSFGIPYQCSTSYVAARTMWEQVNEGLFNVTERQRLQISCPYPEMENMDMKPTDFKGLNDFYERRSKHRRFWASWVEGYNLASPNKCQLYLDAVQRGNHILTGIRKLHELQAFHATGIPDLTIWVDRPGINRDITQEFGPEWCELTIRNDNNLARLKEKVSRLRWFFNYLSGKAA